MARVHYTSSLLVICLSGSGLDIGSIEFNSIDYFLAWYPFVESRSTDPD